MQIVDNLLDGNLSALLTLTAGTPFDRYSEQCLSSYFSYCIRRSLDRQEILLRRVRLSRFLDWFLRFKDWVLAGLVIEETEWGLGMLLMLISRFVVHFVKGVSLGAGMCMVEHWLDFKISNGKAGYSQPFSYHRL